jgi:hypothetical protein
MKFDDFINHKYNELGVLREEAQTSNVISDLFKNVKTIVKGGKPAEAPSITLKDSSKLKELEKLTVPKYKDMENTPNLLSNLQKDSSFGSIEQRIVYNLITTLNATAASGGELKLSLYDLTGDPKVRFGDTKGTGGNIKNPTNFEDLKTQAQKTLKPAIDSGILKWEEPRELSPQDLANRAVDKTVSGVGKAANWAVNLDTGVNYM